MTTSIFIRIDQPDFVVRPGIPIAQILREITPVLENMNPLVSSYYPDRLSNITKAEWTVQTGVALAAGEFPQPEPA